MVEKPELLFDALKKQLGLVDTSTINAIPMEEIESYTKYRLMVFSGSDMPDILDPEQRQKLLDRVGDPFEFYTKEQLQDVFDQTLEWFTRYTEWIDSFGPNQSIANLLDYCNIDPLMGVFLARAIEENFPSREHSETEEPMTHIAASGYVEDLSAAISFGMLFGYYHALKEEKVAPRGDS